MLAVCIDMEGVLIPEMWPLIAEKLGINELAITTREEPNYTKLVARRIEILNQHNKTLNDIQNIVASLKPYEGAAAFLAHLAQHCQVILVSDAFFEMVKPLWLKLGSPSIECHTLITDSDNRISHAHYSRSGKHEVVERLNKRGFKTLAIGDAFNDIGMLTAAHQGFLFRPSLETAQAARSLPIIQHYNEVLQRVSELISQPC